jgi:hypothetical protein
MPYVENRTIHDADSHVMEFPDTICEFIEAKFQRQFQPFMRQHDQSWIDEIKALHRDPEFRASAEEEIMLRRGHQALGAFVKEDRPQTHWTTMAWKQVVPMRWRAPWRALTTA